MTVAELIKTLKKFPKTLPVFVESAPWGCPFEVKIVQRTEVGYTHSKDTTKGVFVGHGVGD